MRTVGSSRLATVPSQIWGYASTHPPTHPPAACPARVEQPRVRAVLLHLVAQHRRVLHGVPHEEGAAVARTEGGLRLRDAHLGARNLIGQRKQLGRQG